MMNDWNDDYNDMNMWWYYRWLHQFIYPVIMLFSVSLKDNVLFGIPTKFF